MDTHTNDTGDQAPTADHSKTETTTVRDSWEESEEPSVSIVNAVAAATGRPMTDLPPLQHSVDTDALDTLLTSGSSSLTTISFTYAETLVSARRNGTIEIYVDAPASEAAQD